MQQNSKVQAFTLQHDITVTMISKSKSSVLRQWCCQRGSGFQTPSTELWS